MEETIQQHIEMTPGVCGGKPRIAGHRIRVQDIVVEYEYWGKCPEEIVYHYPTITLADVHAALAYYYDNIEEIRQYIRDAEMLEAELRAKNPSVLHQKHSTNDNQNLRHHSRCGAIHPHGRTQATTPLRQ